MQQFRQASYVTYYLAMNAYNDTIRKQGASSLGGNEL